MRILAIRGANLASLPEFSIDFTSDPLDRTGLFAITGKTGAGKSTILDALCVALFDKTPRLTGGGAMIGRTDEVEEARVNAGDVRSIVRQGTTGGSAEVDFVGRDGRRYRSTWMARRARSRVDGKFQAQTVSLLDLESNQPLGGTKTETLTLIQEKIGLTYDQFRRSVLLAQGEFAAFLKAEGKERAELLEKITGTGIYARLSVAAFGRKRAEEQALEQLMQHLGSIALMNDDERNAALLALEDQETALGISRSKIAELERAEGWYIRHDQLAEGVATAVKSLDESRHVRDGLLPQREQLQLLDSIEPLRPAVAAVDRTSEAAKLAVTRRDKLLQSVSESRLLLDARRTAVGNASTALEEMAKQFDAARPQIGKARELDTRLQEARKLFDVRSSEFQGAQAQSTEAGEIRTRLEKEFKEAAQGIAEADSWLSSHEWARVVLTEWERWKTELGRYISSVARVNAIAASIATGTKTSHMAEAEHKKARKAMEATEEIYRQKAGLLLTAEDAAGIVDIVAIRKQIDSVQECVTASAELHRIAEEAQKATDEREHASSRILSLSETMKQLAESRDTDKAGIPVSTAARNEAERALNLARAAMDLEEHRSNLQDNEQCPLCGSCEHPYRTGNTPPSGMLLLLETRFVELRDTVTAIESRMAASAVRQEALQSELGRERQALKLHSEIIDQLTSLWTRQIARFPAGELSTDPCQRDSLSLALRLNNDSVAELASLRGVEGTAHSVLAAVAPARAAADNARKEFDKARESVAGAELADRDAAQAVKSLMSDFSREEQNLISLSELLAHPFAGWDRWRERIAEDSDGFMAAAEISGILWNDWCDRREKLVVQREEAGGRVNEAMARCELLQTSLCEKQGAMKVQEKVVAALLAERSVVLDGRPVEEVEQKLSSGLAATQEKVRTAAEGAAAAEKEVTASSGKLEEAENQLVSAVQNEKEARNILGTARVPFGKPEEEVRELLSTSAEWRKECFERLLKADSDFRDAFTRLSERRDLLEVHKNTDVPLVARDDLVVSKEAAGVRVRDLEDGVFSLRHIITVDTDNRKNADILLPRIEAQREKTTLWQGMNDLIGSADGKKFRTFAQSMTLDLLLDMANEHLSSLSPRFLLMRVPSSEMELQVIDRDMGDDIRGVNSISGGESFLVSLALALGLSTLASGTTRIASLFIDEGFGSLDQETLEVALSTLDSLQATGRMVGVISHIASLTERIGTRIVVSPTGVGTSKVTVQRV